MGPQALSPVPQILRRRARPFKRALTSGSGESSRSRPELSPPPADEGSSPQLSPGSRIRRPLFIGHPILGNVDLHARDFHREPFYDVPALTTDPRFKDSMRLIMQYSLLPFTTSRQFYYPRVVLQFYHSMTSRGVPSRWSSGLALTTAREYSELRTFQLLWACQQSWPILEDTEISPSHHRERWSAVLLEILRRRILIEFYLSTLPQKSGFL